MATNQALSQYLESHSQTTSFLDKVRAATSLMKPVDAVFNSGSAWAQSSPISRYSIVQISPKAQEAQRQIERVRSLASIPEDDASTLTVREKSIVSTISLIQSCFSGPLPIPVASSGSEGGATLFFETDGIYGDLEINGSTVEYYLRCSRAGEVVEVYDSEEIEVGYFPPKLLTALFSFYVR